jgi:hypothetical protein
MSDIDLIDSFLDGAKSGHYKNLVVANDTLYLFVNRPEKKSNATIPLMQRVSAKPFGLYFMHTECGGTDAAQIVAANVLKCRRRVRIRNSALKGAGRELFLFNVDMPRVNSIGELYLIKPTMEYMENPTVVLGRYPKQVAQIIQYYFAIRGKFRVELGLAKHAQDTLVKMLEISRPTVEQYKQWARIRSEGYGCLISTRQIMATLESIKLEAVGNE